MNFIDTHDFSVGLVLRVLSVAVSTYYGWRARRVNPGPRARQDAELLVAIDDIRGQSEFAAAYGSPRVWLQLRKRGVRVGRKRVERIMRVNGTIPAPCLAGDLRECAHLMQFPSFGIKRCCGGSVFMAEEAHDDRQRDALLVEIHRLGFAQQVAVDVRRDRKALSTCGFGGLLEHGGDGVSGQFGRSPAVQTVEQRPGRRKFGDIRVELIEVDVQVLDGLLGERYDAGPVALAGKQDLPGLGQAQILQRVRPVISPTRAAVSYSRISSIRFLRDFAVCPVNAARIARV